MVRRHGDRVRAAVAGGTLPPNVVWPAEVAASFYGAVAGLAASCAADPSCAAAYGDLVERLGAGIYRLYDEPIRFDHRGGEVVIHGAYYAWLIRQAMYSRGARRA